MSERERQSIVKALEAIASALSFCETDMELAMRDRLDALHGAIEELVANDDSAPKNGVSDDKVDANDADAASVSVSGFIETENETGEQDSREKLLEDANAVAIDYWDKKRTWGEANDLKREIIALLDRQAAIIEREHPGLTVSEDESLINWRGENYLLQSRALNAERERDEFSLKLKHEMELNRDNRNALDLERIADLQQQADDLRGEWHRVCAERANLARDLGECMADRDRYRALCGQMLDAAHEIRRIADANMPEGAVV